jgi:hypothetical protein
MIFKMGFVWAFAATDANIKAVAIKTFMADLAGEDHRSLSLFRGHVPLLRSKLMQNPRGRHFALAHFRQRSAPGAFAVKSGLTPSPGLLAQTDLSPWER